jgi:hypothetical protein
VITIRSVLLTPSLRGHLLLLAANAQGRFALEDGAAVKEARSPPLTGGAKRS